MIKLGTITIKDLECFNKRIKSLGFTMKELKKGSQFLYEAMQKSKGSIEDFAKELKRISKKGHYINRKHEYKPNRKYKGK